MRHMRKCMAVILGIAVLASGCGKKNESTKAEIMPETVPESDTATIGASLFPESYTGGSERVKFDCTLEVPKEFDSDKFYRPEVTGLQYIDQDVAYDTYIEGENVEAQYQYPTDDENVPEQDIYVLADGTQVIIDAGLNYLRPEGSSYLYVMRDNEVGASQNNFSYGTGEDSVAQVEKSLADMVYPTNEFQFSWFSLSGEEHMTMEQEKLDKGEIGPEDMRIDWTSVEGEYEIFAWQTYEGLQVFPQRMTMGMAFAYENYQNAPVQAIVSDQGILTLVAEAPYNFEESSELLSFLPFSEIASKVEEKYENLLLDDDSVYTVERAKLAMRVYVDESQHYAAEPVWYLEVSDNNGSEEVLLFNAASGKEIFLV